MTETEILIALTDCRESVTWVLEYCSDKWEELPSRQDQDERYAPPRFAFSTAKELGFLESGVGVIHDPDGRVTDLECDFIRLTPLGVTAAEYARGEKRKTLDAFRKQRDRRKRIKVLQADLARELAADSQEDE